MRRFVASLPLAVLVLVGCASAGGSGLTTDPSAARSIFTQTRPLDPAAPAIGGSSAGAAGNVVEAAGRQPVQILAPAQAPINHLNPAAQPLPPIPNPNAAPWRCSGTPTSDGTIPLCLLK